MSSKSDDNEPIVSTDSQMNVKTLPESAVKKKPDIFSDFAHGDKEKIKKDLIEAWNKRYKED